MTLRDDHYELMKEVVDPDAKNQRVRSRFTVGRLERRRESR